MASKDLANADTTRYDFVSTFPRDVINLIFDLLDIKTLCRVSKVSKRWKYYEENMRDKWKKLTMSSWGVKPESLPEKLEKYLKKTYSDWKLIHESVVFVHPAGATCAGVSDVGVYDPESPWKFHGEIPGIIYPKLSTSLSYYASSIQQGCASVFVHREDVFCWTLNRPRSWFMVDFGPNIKVFPYQYTLKYGSTQNYCTPRNWELQASNNEKVENNISKKSSLMIDQDLNTDDEYWVTLSKHKDDTTLNSEFAWFSFPIPECKIAFRYFRIIQTGPNAFLKNAPGSPIADNWSDVLVVSGFDLFGFRITKKDPRANSLYKNVY